MQIYSWVLSWWLSFMPHICRAVVWLLTCKSQSTPHCRSYTMWTSFCLRMLLGFKCTGMLCLEKKLSFSDKTDRWNDNVVPSIILFLISWCLMFWAFIKSDVQERTSYGMMNDERSPFQYMGHLLNQVSYSSTTWAF